MAANELGAPSHLLAAAMSRERPTLLAYVGASARACRELKHESKRKMCGAEARLADHDAQNRRLRHLHGISVRNLRLVPGAPNGRTRTADDEAVPSSLRSPMKVLAERETKGLAHSRSSNDLRPDPKKGEVHDPKARSRSARSTSNSFRRRNAVEWADANALDGQERFEHAISSRMADTFFSLHVDHVDDAVYISEVVPKAMNPNFRFFDLDACGPSVTRLDQLTVRIWARNGGATKWQFLLEGTIHLRALHFIGKTLGGFHHPLPPNCLLFHMSDGIYTNLMDLPAAERPIPALAAPPKAMTNSQLQPTSSYDALMRLSTLDDCIQDALATRERLAEDIESILEQNQGAMSTVSHVPEAEEQLRTVQDVVAVEQRRAKATRRRRDELRAGIQARREAMQRGREARYVAAQAMAKQQEQHEKDEVEVQRIEDEITGQRRRVCEDLFRIYPIEPVEGKPLAFTICGLPLPNSEFDDAKEDEVAAALGHVAQVVSQLSPYLSVVVPYPVRAQGSTSLIDDPLSMTTGPRTFPLFLRGVVRYRFEYAVFLLNKDIETVAGTLGLRLVDIRPTLANLKYVLFVATAGKGELPARKAGGIRGLLRHDQHLSPLASIERTPPSAAPVGRKAMDAAESNGMRVSAVQ